MGEVVDLSRYRKPKRRQPTRRKKRGAPWTYQDLKGKHPRRHPPLRRGPGGKVLLAEGQAWVEHGSKELWVVQAFWEARKAFYPHQVVLVPYRRKGMRMLCEASLRQHMKVWDEYGEFARKTMEKLDYLSEHDPTSPFYGRPDAAQRGRALFGLDAKGNRIRD